MNDVVEPKPKRKLLSLKKDKAVKSVDGQSEPFFLKPDISIYMVWCPEGYMPKKVYGPDEKARAVADARSLANATGKRFYVMRSWRAYEAKPDEVLA